MVPGKVPLSYTGGTTLMSRRTHLSNRIVETVNQMPTEVRKVFILSHYKGFSLGEIAERLGKQREEVASLLRCGNVLIARIAPVS